MNSLTGRLQSVVTNEQKEVKIFACGPTVYDYIHLGNARPLLLTDINIRNLRYQGYTIDYAQNITEIDDKIINRAIESHISEEELASSKTKHYLQNMHDLNVIMPNHIQPISKIITEQIDFVQSLINNNDAYISEGNVFFKVSNYLRTIPCYYGQLASRRLENNQINLSKNNPLQKQNPLDFALWKQTEVGVTFTPSWTSHPGRPGWHTECAVVNALHFNQQTIDIHIGGIDLKFPHHENERIQYVAAFKKELAKVWVHNGHLEINNLKMSKSLRNMIYVHEFLKAYSADTLRLIFYTSPYSKPLNISNDLVEQSEKTLTKIKLLNNRLNNVKKNAKSVTTTSGDWTEEVVKQLNNNLNTANVITLLFKLMKQLNYGLVTENINYNLIKQWRIIIFDILGLTLQ